MLLYLEQSFRWSLIRIVLISQGKRWWTTSQITWRESENARFIHPCSLVTCASLFLTMRHAAERVGMTSSVTSNGSSCQGWAIWRGRDLLCYLATCHLDKSMLMDTLLREFSKISCFVGPFHCIVWLVQRDVRTNTLSLISIEFSIETQLNTLTLISIARCLIAAFDWIYLKMHFFVSLPEKVTFFLIDSRLS